MKQGEQTKILDTIKDAIEATTLWSVDSNPKGLPEGCRAIAGTSPDGWVIMAVEFDVEEQGVPKGTKGYDGTARKSPYLVRLPRDIAEKAAERAGCKTT